MTGIEQNLIDVRFGIPERVMLVAVSKNHPVNSLKEAYVAGQRVFGENKVQEIIAKRPFLPSDIEWHMIGHLQTNKVKQIAPFISLIQSVDTGKLLFEISKQAERCNRVIDCLLQVYIAQEETKFGFDEKELAILFQELKHQPLPGVRICGLMGMATFTDDEQQIRNEFKGLNGLFLKIKREFFAQSHSFSHLSMGMSGDFKIAIEEGSTIVRIGTKIFGSR
ncbi:MAG: YggS family pyridoxal phosphate-dependent enzyme [Bacteroidales bacterium]|jgi:hypothetical protein